jgi:hypothetical protein
MAMLRLRASTMPAPAMVAAKGARAGSATGLATAACCELLAAVWMAKASPHKERSGRMYLTSMVAAFVGAWSRGLAPQRDAGLGASTPTMAPSFMRAMRSAKW